MHVSSSIALFTVNFSYLHFSLIQLRGAGQLRVLEIAKWPEFYRYWGEHWGVRYCEVCQFFISISAIKILNRGIIGIMVFFKRVGWAFLVLFKVISIKTILPIFPPFKASCPAFRKELKKPASVSWVNI